MISWALSPLHGAISQGMFKAVDTTDEAVDVAAYITQATLEADKLTFPDSVLKAFKPLTEAQLRNAVGEWAHDALYGQHDAGWLVYFDAYIDFGYDEAKKAKPLLDLARNCSWWWPYREGCLLSEKPSIVKFDGDANNARLHAEGGPALKWENWELYYWHGVSVPKRAIMEPDSYTASEIVSMPNVEVARSIFEIVGVDTFMRTADATELHKDMDGAGMPRRLMQFGRAGTLNGSEPLTVLQVTDPSTLRVYHLTVPPEMQTCHQAAAWTFNIKPEQYNPVLEA